MDTYVIEKGVPLVDGRTRESVCPFPFSVMEIGDSFVIPVTVETLAAARARVSKWVRNHRKNTGLRSFSVATRMSGSEMRVWRSA